MIISFAGQLGAVRQAWWYALSASDSWFQASSKDLFQWFRHL
jgi:hypothetical protein